MISDSVVPIQNASVTVEAKEFAPSRARAVGRCIDSRTPLRIICVGESEVLDEQLLADVGYGQKEALALLLQRHGRTVYNVARRILKDEAEAEDLVQELFLYIFQKAATFDPAKGSGSSWIIQMAYHRSIDRRRYLGVRQHYSNQDEDVEELRSGPQARSVDDLTARDLLEKLRVDLSADQIQTLELHFFEGYSLQEIAELKNQKLGNIRNHYYRGLDRLRSYIFPEKRP
jgi:RNA polymerase sigma-70 factor, ECF subfamily